ncbi:MAG TPA: AAA family ATPase [Acidimicrobiales bacterium]|nr:AAA family ATPase [Acidimicrobiales bacterium]
MTAVVESCAECGDPVRLSHPRPGPYLCDRHVVEGPAFFVDWPAFWERDRAEAEWIVPDVLARGRGHSIYAARKEGKSLLTLALVAASVSESTDVIGIYLDYEMGEDDLHERLSEMGYGPESDLSRLQYALLPALPPLDTKAGAEVLMSTIDAVQDRHPGCHPVVIIDTTSRAVSGDENSADTIRAFYRHTGLALKQRGATWARLDHAGKDADKGQRGSSAKGDDVDVVWRLRRTEDGVKLTRELSRMNWVPAEVTFHQSEMPLRFVRTSGGWPAGTAEVARLLDELEVAVEASTRAAFRTLSEAGEGRRAEIVRAAMKYRKHPEYTRDPPRDPPRGEVWDPPPDPHPGNGSSPAPDPPWDPAGPTSAGKGAVWGSRKGTHPGPPTWDDLERAENR